MKFILVAILAGSLAGCASISEYGQGCRDGVRPLVPLMQKEVGQLFSDGDYLDKYCDRSESFRERRPKGKAAQ